MIIQTIEDVNIICKTMINVEHKNMFDFEQKFNLDKNALTIKIVKNRIDLSTFLDISKKCYRKVYIGTELIESCEFLKIFIKNIIKYKSEEIKNLLLPYTFIISNARFFFKDLLEICKILGLEIEVKK